MVKYKNGKIYREHFELACGTKTRSYADIVCDSVCGAGIIVHMYLQERDTPYPDTKEGARIKISNQSSIIADSLEIYDKTYEPRVVYERVEVPVEVEKEVEICVNFYADGLIDYLYNWYCDFKGREFNEECIEKCDCKKEK